MATIMEILSKPIEERKSLYNVSTPLKRIDEVEIDGQKFSGYKAFSFLWEKSYHKEPTRSSEGTIGNLNDYTSFITPHLKIDFSILSIDDYRRIMQLVYSKNEFTVTCYDVVNDRMTTNKMYFATEEMPKLFLLNRALNGEEWIELLGIDGYTVEMIGTNADLDTVTVTYLQIDPKSNAVIGTYSRDVYARQEILIGYDVPFKNELIHHEPDYYIFNNKWHVCELNENGQWVKTNAEYFDNTAITINGNITFAIGYVKRDDRASFIVYLEHGVGQPTKDEFEQDILYFSMVYYDTFSLDKYTSPNPKVTFLGETFEPYDLKGWYYTPDVGYGSTPLEGEIFNIPHDVTIYQVYKAKEYTLSFNTGVADITMPSITAKYGEQVAVPKISRIGYEFKGWYYKDGYGNLIGSFDGTMPPKDMTIYAIWG